MELRRLICSLMKMRINIRPTLVLCGLVLLAVIVGTARSQLYIYEAFDYGDESGPTNLQYSIEHRAELSTNGSVGFWNFPTTNSVQGRISELRKIAQAGDVTAQIELAEWLVRSSVTNRTEAYKWAWVASIQGHKEARHVLSELDLFLPSEQRQEAKALAEQYLAGRKTAKEATEDQEPAASERLPQDTQTGK